MINSSQSSLNLASVNNDESIVLTIENGFPSNGDSADSLHSTGSVSTGIAKINNDNVQTPKCNNKSPDLPLILDDITLEKLLDIPHWSAELKQIEFKTIEQFENALIKWEDILQQVLECYDYNTFGSYVDFYHSYQKSNSNLTDFILNYQAKITTESMSCVAQSLVLMQNLSANDSLYGSNFSLVSCEEMIMIMTAENGEGKLQTKYQLDAKNNVKEHVLVCLKFQIADNNRSGYVLLDPGYHISRPIIVMNDCLFPHTGWFNASKNRKVCKDYCYQIINDQYIAWKVRETNINDPNEVIKQYLNIIYIHKEFIKYASVTEKRACIFSLKSYVVRNRKGAVAGFYSWIEEKNLTIFYEENGKRITNKFHINDLDKQEEVKCCLEKVAAYTKDSKDYKSFINILTDYRQSLYDEEFCFDLCEIDKWIEED
uniref:Uncharacterized protein LOC113788865 n=1 Tax=Dermatophagoides pteronyssinus TaxID=6956 RepID=A0A6P6XKT0_DERPT|nr:uncharacterized protein LOC113788865 [Dermatophagoides pteronyssinus]